MTHMSLQEDYFILFHTIAFHFLRTADFRVPVTNVRHFVEAPGKRFTGKAFPSVSAPFRATKKLHEPLTQPGLENRTQLHPYIKMVQSPSFLKH